MNIAPDDIQMSAVSEREFGEGKKYFVFDMTVKYNGADMFQEYICRQTGDYIFFIAVTGADADAVNGITDFFR